MKTIIDFGDKRELAGDHQDIVLSNIRKIWPDATVTPVDANGLIFNHSMGRVYFGDISLKSNLVGNSQRVIGHWSWQSAGTICRLIITNEIDSESHHDHRAETHEFTRQECPVSGCGQKSIRAHPQMETLMGYSAYVDTERRVHFHDRNTHTVEFVCSSNHRWTAGVYPLCWCKWPEVEEPEHIKRPPVLNEDGTPKGWQIYEVVGRSIVNLKGIIPGYTPHIAPVQTIYITEEERAILLGK